ncbi:MAG TPA: protein kinase [Baekduia sp.]
MADSSKRSAASMPQLLPGSVFAGYRIECLIDRGGMGVVYKAIDPDLDRPVALKIIAPEHSQNETAVARFKAECRLAASLEHPNIVPIHRGGQYEGVLYLAMRFVPGTNLRAVIDQGPMALPRIARIVDQVGAALDVAHDRGLVHRDVKPANILLSGTGEHEQVYLTDFGLTKRLGSAGDALTRAGGWVGTPDYVAPEQIQGHNVDRRADVYSLGCVLFEMLTGRVAYAKDSDMAKLWAHVTDPPPLPRTQRPELGQAFDDTVARATAKDPDDRFATAGELAAAVDAAVSEQQRADQLRAAAAPAVAADLAGAATRDETFVTGPSPGEGDPAVTGREPVGVGAAPPPADPPADAGRQDTPPPPPPPRGAPAAGRREPPPPGRRTGRGSGGGDGWFSRHRVPVIGVLALVVAGIAAFAVLGGSSDDTSSKEAAAPLPGQRVNGNLGPVPTNHVSGGDGTATMRLDGRSLKVSVDTKGLLNGAPHALHIHAGGKGQCPPASAASLHNGHRSIATHAGVPFYGGAVEALTTRGDTSIPRSLVAFSRYPNTSDVKYRRTLKITPIVASYIKKNNAVLVVHGIDYNSNGVYDGVLERSDLDRSLTGESTAPALCGRLVAEKKAKAGTSTTKSAQLRSPSTSTVYRVALAPAPAPPPGALLCPLSTPGHAEFRTA